MDQLLNFEGCNFLRQRLVLATLSCRPVKITKIREEADEPGLKGIATVKLSWGVMKVVLIFVLCTICAQNLKLDSFDCWISSPMARE